VAQLTNGYVHDIMLVDELVAGLNGNFIIM
jgi:hypothetical protein